MANENNKRLVEKYLQAWAKADTGTLEKMLDDGFKFNNPPPGISPNKKGAIEMSKLYYKAFPDQDLRIVKTITDGNDVAAVIQVKATHKGEFLGVPASNKRVEVDVLSITTIRGDKIVEDLTQFDSLGLMTQIGAVPEIGPVSR